MPPTPWQTEILATGIWAGAVPRIWRTLSCDAYMPVHAGVHTGKAAAIGVERQLAAGSGVMPAIKAPASPRGTKPRSSRP